MSDQPTERLSTALKWIQVNPPVQDEESRLRKNARVRAYREKRRSEDPGFKITCTLRSRVSAAFRGKGNSKTAKTFVLLGCSLAQLKEHLSSLFLPGMTFENHGAWHIDHIRPCATFDLTKPSHQRECFHYSNLQPMWAFDNFSKNAGSAPRLTGLKKSVIAQKRQKYLDRLRIFREPKPAPPPSTSEPFLQPKGLFIQPQRFTKIYWVDERFLP